MSQNTNPLDLPISGSVGGGEIELKIESATHKYFQIQDKRLRLTRPLDRDAVLKEVGGSLGLKYSSKLQFELASCCIIWLAL